MTKVLITGCAGLIGSHFSRYLIGNGHTVAGVDDLSGGYADFIHPLVLFYEANLNDTKGLAKIFDFVRPDCVYHFAAYAAEGLSPFIRNFNYTNNLIASVNVINNCIEHGAKIVFTSSMAVYGKGRTPFIEEQTPAPEDPYGIAKYAIEMDLKQAHDQFGLKYSVVRPHNVIGIYQNIWDKYRNVIGIWIRRVLRGEPITIFGDGEQTRAFSDIKFCLKPLEKLMTEGDGEIFNLGSDQEYTLNDTAKILQTVGEDLGFSSEIEHLEARHEVKHAYCNHDKAKVSLGFLDSS